MGGDTQILAILNLLKAAVSENKYIYYHLLSGSDLPLTSQENIHSFFEQNKGKEFLTFSGMGTDSKLYDRVRYTYHCSKLTHRITNNKWLQKVIRLYRKIDLKVQKLQKIDRWKKENPNKQLKYGSQWFSITHELVLYILENEQWIEKSFKDTYLCDELFVHTLVYNSKFYEHVYNFHPVKDIPNEQQGNLRYINWWDGSPYTWSLSSKEDLLQLNQGIELGHLFSRKFNLTHQEINEIRRNLFETAINSDSSSLS